MSNEYESFTQEVKYVQINAGTGNNTLVDVVQGKQIRVLAAALTVPDAGELRFEDGANGNALTGRFPVAANGGFVLPWNPAGWFQTSLSTLLNLEVTTATAARGCLVYIEK